MERFAPPPGHLTRHLAHATHQAGDHEKNTDTRRYLVRRIHTVALVLFLLSLAGSSAFAGAKIPINDDATLDLGYMLQVHGYASQEDLDGDEEWDSTRHWKVRRGRLRLKANVGERVTAFLQTEAAANKTMNLIDVWLNFEVDPWVQLYVGRHMAPANRQNVTASSCLMAIDRPGLAYKSLAWGVRATSAFTNSVFDQSVTGLSTPDAVRDLGLTVFGAGELSPDHNFKYYAGIYNGIQAGVDDKDHFTLRAQYNLWDAEGGYFNRSTYLGKKKTLGIGVSYDLQQEVGMSGADLADYTYMTVDGFLELPDAAGNALTVEVGYMMLDFDDAADFMAAQGNGFYGQAGYYLAPGWQPWVEFESFDSDHDSSLGKYTNFRAGVTYYLEGQHANIKLGFEQFKSDQPMVGSEDTINTVLLGFYSAY